MIRHRRQALTAVASAAVLAFSLTGCGSDSLTAEEFKTQADKLCAAADDELDGLDDNLSDDSTREEVEAFLQKGVDRTRELVADIRALDEPSDLSTEVDELLDAVSAGADLIEEKGVELLTAKEDPFEDADKKAKALGLDECGD